MKEERYTVLMSVYYKEKPAYLKTSIESMLNQTIPPDEFVIVKDGPLSKELDAVIDTFIDKHPGLFTIIENVWDGGYDIVNDLDSVFEEFDRIIGLDRLKAIHLNDSMNPLGSHKDRHARIGEGEIGLEALVCVINHPATEGIPFILETPNDDEGWTHEIALLRNEYKQK